MQSFHLQPAYKVGVFAALVYVVQAKVGHSPFVLSLLLAIVLL